MADVTAVAPARKAWFLYGWASQSFPAIVVAVFMPRYLTSVAEHDVGTHGRVHVLGIPIAPGSLFAYDVTASTVLLVVLMPLVGAIADRTRRKRDVMLGCGWVGAVACLAMVFVAGDDWQLGAILFAIAYLGYSCSIVVSYSLLVDLSSSEDRDRVSSVGWAIAYIGGGVLLAANFGLSLTLDKATLARVALCSAGAWWILFSLPVRTRLPRLIGRGSAPGRAARPGAHQRLRPARRDAAAHARLPAHPRLPRRVPDLQRRHPDGDHGLRPVRRQGTAALGHRAAARHPARAVRGVRRCAGVRPARGLVRREAGRARLARGLARGGARSPTSCRPAWRGSSSRSRR